jgi:phytoene dehydrogenase-like protein
MTGRETFDAIVIGAGSNGLVAAAALARASRRVLVLERRDQLGGASQPVEFFAGYRASLSSFDAGWLPPSVARGLGLAELPMVEPESSVTMVPDGGEALSLSRTPALAAAAIRTYSPRDAERWRAFTTRVRKLSGFLEALYQLPPPDIDSTSLGDLAPLFALGRKFRALGRVDMSELMRTLPMPVQDLLDDWFEWAPLKAALGAGGIRDIHQGPRSGGTSFVLLHYLTGAPSGSVRARSWFRDGPDALIAALESHALGSGVTIRPRSVVARVLVRDDAVIGVALDDGTEIVAPVVLSTADPAHTLLHMVDPVWLDPEFLHAVGVIKYRGCTSFVQYALDRLPIVPGLENPAQALAGVMTLSNSLDAMERAYDSAKYGNVSAPPHVEVTVPTTRWPALAPPGKHVLVARAQYSPYHLGGGATWDAAATAALADGVTEVIGRAMPGFTDSVLHRTVLSPRDLEARYGLTGGALTHGELTLDQILFMRPAPGSGRYAMPISGLYLAGNGAHPGPGVLGGSGWLAARRVLADGGRMRRGRK